MPSSRRTHLGFACANRANSFFSSSGVRPLPLSSTPIVIHTVSASSGALSAGLLTRRAFSVGGGEDSKASR